MQSIVRQRRSPELQPTLYVGGSRIRTSTLDDEANACYTISLCCEAHNQWQNLLQIRLAASEEAERSCVQVETLYVGGSKISIRTSALNDKANACNMLCCAMTLMHDGRTCCKTDLQPLKNLSAAACRWRHCTWGAARSASAPARWTTRPMRATCCAVL